MDLCLFSLFLVVALFVFYILIFIFHRKRLDRSNNLPPGKWGWPVIGETVEFGMPGRAQNFIPDRMSRYSPKVFKTSLLGEKVAVLCGPSGNKFVFSNENKLVKIWFPTSLLKLFPRPEAKTMENHSKRRSIYLEFLKPEAVQKYIQVIDFTVKQHLKNEWAPNELLRVNPLAEKLSLAVSFRLFLGVEDPGEQDRLAELYAHIGAGLFSVPIDFPGTTFNRAIRASKVLQSELVKIIQQHKHDSLGNKDSEARILLSHLLFAIDGDGMFMSEVEIISTIYTFLFASIHTNSSTITSIVYYLTENPDVYDKVLKEQIEVAKSKGSTGALTWEDTRKMKYSANVVNEVLRIAPPGPGTFREVIHDISYAGFNIPKGWKIFWSINSTNRDPKYFPNPEKFDPTRFDGNGPVPFTFTPFGGGPRMCPGREYARQLFLVFLHNFIINFTWEKQDPSEKIIFGHTTMYQNGLLIKIRQSSNQAMSDE